MGEIKSNGDNGALIHVIFALLAAKKPLSKKQKHEVYQKLYTFYFLTGKKNETYNTINPKSLKPLNKCFLF